MGKKKMFIKKIEPALTGSFFNVFLQEEDGDRVLNITVGEFEAQRMSIEIDGIAPVRPLTYDLFCNVLREYNIDVEEVFIDRFYEGIYYANIVCFDGINRKVIDARTSDAINMALKYKTSIFANEEILEQVGFSANEIEKDEIVLDEISIIIEKPVANLIKDLESLLEVAIEKEDYDIAAKLRDEIKLLKNEK